MNSPGESSQVQPLVTIAIPTYNRADGHLLDVVDAALGQTYRKTEVIVGNNASTDATAEVLGSVSDPRLKVINHTRNLGANGNFNSLLEHARGEWFLLFHDDDMIDPDFVESCLAAVEPGQDYGFIRTGVRAINSKGETIKERPNSLIGQSREALYQSWFRATTGFYLCNTLYHTERLREIGGFHSLHNLLEDNYALVRLLNHWDHANVEDVKASYRYTYEQRTYQVPVREWCEDFRQLLEMIVEQCAPEMQTAIRNEGTQFFGRLCNRRANAIESPLKRAVARLIVARYFGLTMLRQPWRLARK